MWSFNYVVRFGFKATNNIAEYKALLTSLKLAREMQIKRLLINSDSQLVVSQIIDNFSGRDKSISTNLKLMIDLVPS